MRIFQRIPKKNKEEVKIKFPVRGDDDDERIYTTYEEEKNCMNR